MSLDELTDYAFNFIKDVEEKFGPRFSCSDAEKRANLWIKDEFSSYCDETFFETFETWPNLYPQGFVKILGFLAGISFIFIPLFFPLPILSAICICLGLYMFYAHLVQMKRWMKIFFKKGTSSNAWGRIQPSGEVKWRIVFEGHTDSAKQMRLGEKAKPNVIPLILGFVYLAFTIVFSILKFFHILIGGTAVIIFNFWIIQWTSLDTIYLISLIILYPFFIYTIRSFTGNTVVPGAADNLSGSAVSAAVGKYFSKNRPKNVEIIIGSMGSEENGDRGAEYFVENHGDLLENSYAFIVETIGQGDRLYIIEKDFHTHGKMYSPEVIKRIEKAHELYKKEDPDVIYLEKGGVPIGSSDACMYLNAGYKAAFIIVVSKETRKPRYWHSVEDTWKNIDKKVLKDVIGVCLKFVELVDKEFK
jgi:hypothetical protein